MAELRHGPHSTRNTQVGNCKEYCGNGVEAQNWFAWKAMNCSTESAGMVHVVGRKTGVSLQYTA